VAKKNVEKKLIEKIEKLRRLVARLKSENDRLRKRQERIPSERPSILIFPAKTLQSPEKGLSITPNRPYCTP